MQVKNAFPIEGNRKLSSLTLSLRYHYKLRVACHTQNLHDAAVLSNIFLIFSVATHYEPQYFTVSRMPPKL